MQTCKFNKYAPNNQNIKGIMKTNEQVHKSTQGKSGGIGDNFLTIATKWMNLTTILGVCSSSYTIKSVKCISEEMAQQLRILSVSKDLTSLVSIHIKATHNPF